MTYSATYDTDDVAPIVIDGALTIAVVVVGFATLLGLVIVFNLLRGRRWHGKK